MPERVKAQFAVYDAANFSESALQYAPQLTQLADQVKQLDAQMQALAKLDRVPWRDIRGAVTTLTATMRQANTLGYALRTAGTQFRTTFPVSRPITDYPTEQVTQATRAVGTMRSSLDAIGTQSAGLSEALARLTQMKSAVGTIQGHEQALELENAATVFTAEELLLIRQGLMTENNMLAVYFGAELNGQTQRDVTVRTNLVAMAGPSIQHADISLRITP
jgi:P-type conjugative transfer protein TrbJ